MSSFFIHGDVARRYNRESVYYETEKGNAINVSHTHEHPGFVNRALETIDLRTVVSTIAELKFDITVYEEELKKTQLDTKRIQLVTNAKKEDEELLHILNEKVKSLIVQDTPKEFSIWGDIASRYNKDSVYLGAVNKKIINITHTHEYPGFILYRLNNRSKSDLDKIIGRLNSDILSYRENLDKYKNDISTYNIIYKAILEDETLRDVLQMRKKLLS